MLVTSKHDFDDMVVLSVVLPLPTCITLRRIADDQTTAQENLKTTLHAFNALQEIFKRRPHKAPNTTHVMSKTLQDEGNTSPQTVPAVTREPNTL